MVSAVSNDQQTSSNSVSKYIYGGSALAGAGFCSIGAYANQLKDIKALKVAEIKDIVELSKPENLANENLGKIGQLPKNLVEKLVKGKIHPGHIAKGAALGAALGIVASLILGLPMLGDIFSNSKKVAKETTH